MTMQPGAEMDRMVAENVMGWRVHKRNSIYYVNAGDEDDVMRDEKSAKADTCGCNRFAPSSNISHTWEVVRHMANTEQRNAVWWNCTAGSYVCIDVNEDMPKTLGRVMFDCPDRMPHAICLAALMAVGAIEAK